MAYLAYVCTAPLSRCKGVLSSLRDDDDDDDDDDWKNYDKPSTSDVFTLNDFQARSYVGGRGQFSPPQTLALPPNVTWKLKHCLMNSKHRHIGAKRSVLWPVKYAKFFFWPGLCPEPRWVSSWRSPDPCSAEKGTPHPILHPFGASIFFWGGGAMPQIFFLEPPLAILALFKCFFTYLDWRLAALKI